MLLDFATPRQDFDHKLHLKSDSELHDRVDTTFHPMSICEMAKKMDALLTDNFVFVVLTDIGLCDASIFPNNGIGS